MAIATALRGFNDLGHSVTPTFLSKNEQKLNVENLKISFHGTSNPAILWLQGAGNYGR